MYTHIILNIRFVAVLTFLTFPNLFLSSRLSFFLFISTLRHFVTYDVDDGRDISHELRNLFCRTNILISGRFGKCSVDITIVLF